MKNQNPFRYFKTSPEIIRLAVMMYVRFPLSLRNVEDLLHERGIDICHETVRYWWNRFGPMFARDIRKKRHHPIPKHSNWKWHLDEVFVKINGETHYLWRAVDHEGEVLEFYVTKRRSKAAALKLPTKAMRRARKQDAISITESKICTCRSGDGNEPCPDFGGCKVCRSSFQSIRQCTITSILKGASTPEFCSIRSETPLFARGATSSSPGTCCPANIGDGFGLD